MNEDEIKELLMLLTLRNALKYGGKANKKAIMSKIMGERADLRSQARMIMPILDQVIQEISSLNVETQKDIILKLDPHALDKKEKRQEVKKLPELPNLIKHDKVIMRLAPYPSGALHIGNARMVVLNHEYSKRNDGELILFYDDTIGSPQALRNTPRAKFVAPEAYDLIKEGLEWLGVNYSKIYYKSDRLEIYYEYCERLIKDGMAYACFCKGQEFKERYKTPGIDCPHRSNSIEKNLEEWQNILDRKYHEMTVVIRLKTGMDQKDPALRDQIIMRISEAEHPRIGSKYIVWPMLEFSWAIDDHLIGITHIVRGADLVKEDFIEDFIWEHFKWKKAEFLHYGRIKFVDMKLSKTHARNMIQSGDFMGWDDPRTWSLQSLEKRGFKPDALRETLLDLGMSITGITFSVSWLYAKNKSIIDKQSDRYFFVEDPIELTVGEMPYSEMIAEPFLIPSNPKRGSRKIPVKGDEGTFKLFITLKDVAKMKVSDIIRLKDLVNIEIISVDQSLGEVRARFHSKELNRDYSIIHWVPMKDNIQVKILKPNGEISSGFGEINLFNIPLNKPIQFERYGFVNPIKRENNELSCYFTH